MGASGRAKMARGREQMRIKSAEERRAAAKERWARCPASYLIDREHPLDAARANERDGVMQRNMPSWDRTCPSSRREAHRAGRHDHAHTRWSVLSGCGKRPPLLLLLSGFRGPCASPQPGIRRTTACSVVRSPG